MHNFNDINEAWKQGFIDGCIDVKGTYTGVPPIPILKVKPGEDPIDVYYKDGFAKGGIYAMQTLAGNNKSLRN
ncbi:hypothetical protein FD977_04610 [Polynucleobacter sp. AP-Elch-400A-B2]|jgi:hypothetical protein|uniref:hypothetical protein n=1 Tax=Polynucleobacter sp. AP-Elch-400A-B2 TaxID=2576930 RepID=UPI001BFD4588|nr:hypothetical protein [Polynucleobacter sp. AP-Elch-400A-B2]QWE25527.1 hypothetical protein FD977_04610 [Polynucleobacter sp. AP-Elch-400A-B2]